MKRPLFTRGTRYHSVLLWRGGGLAVLLSFCSVVVFVLPVFLIIRGSAAMWLMAPFTVLLIFASSLFSYGWATLRVSRLAENT